MTRRIIGPFNRVEGDLEVKIDVTDGVVRDAWVNSPLFRGFERILHGRDPGDALVYVPRICGICSVSQSMAAAMALAGLQGVKAPDNGEIARNIILGVENIADHLTHFYLFFMPDFCRATYGGEPWFEKAAERFTALRGTAARDMLPARANFLHILGTLAGKWPHTLALQPGGTSRAIAVQEQMRLIAILTAFRRFLEKTLFGAPLERIATLDSARQLVAYAGEDSVETADFRHFLKIAAALDLAGMGRAADHFLSYGSYWQAGEPLFARGQFAEGCLSAFDPADIAEDGAHAWLAPADGPLHPFDGVTMPDATKAAAYSWCKAPRLAGKTVEVGALARQIVDGQPLLRDLAARTGGNVLSRVTARLVEVARLVIAMERWLDQLRPGEAFCVQGIPPQDGQAVGMVEAARGALGHWVRVRHGKILNYQIIAPTTWNFSPRDGDGQRGALEMALLGAPVRMGEDSPIAVQHIVRSFDPCMVCTVH